MPRAPKSLPLSEAASFLGVPFEGEGRAEIAGFASIGSAASDELVFVRDEAAAIGLSASNAGAVIAPAGVDTARRPTLRSERPAADFSRLVAHFAPRPRPPVGVAQGAQVDPGAEVDPTASIDRGACIGPGCRVGPRTVVGSGAILVSDVIVGADGWIHAGAVLREGTRVGDRVVLQPGVVLGGDGFGYVADSDGRPTAMAQVGRVVLEDEVEIGANTTVDRGTLDETRIRRGAKIDNQVQIAHNCDVGEDVLIAAQSGLSGHTRVEARAILMARCGTTGHLTIGAGAFLGANTSVHHDVPAGARIYGVPAMEERAWHRSMAALRRLPELLKRVRRLERSFGAPDSDARD